MDTGLPAPPAPRLTQTPQQHGAVSGGSALLGQLLERGGAIALGPRLLSQGELAMYLGTVPEDRVWVPEKALGLEALFDREDVVELLSRVDSNDTRRGRARPEFAEKVPVVVRVQELKQAAQTISSQLRTSSLPSPSGAAAS